jgi:L-2-amino-thiazoline-4-carboxylic acid hydrolase
MDDEKARDLLRRSFAMRAAAYGHMFDVLREEFGEEQALALGMKATRRMGETMGKAFADKGPDDLSGLKDAFLGGIIEGEHLFAPEVTRCDAGELNIFFHRCPLKEAWVAQGRSDHDVAALCKLAGAIDGGLFESAGFTFAGTTWQPGESGCCKLRVLPGPKVS